MHEYSLVRSLLRQVAEIIADQGDCLVSQVHLEVGEFAGVELQLLELAFQDLAPELLGPQISLRVESVPIRAKCEVCGQTTTIQNYNFQCSECDSSQVILISGEDIRLVDIEVIDEPALN